MTSESSDFAVVSCRGKFVCKHTCYLGVQFPREWRGRTIILVDRNNFVTSNMGNQDDKNIYLILRINFVFNSMLNQTLKIDKNVLFRDSNSNQIDSYFGFEGSLWPENSGIGLSITQIANQNKRYIIKEALGENLKHPLSTVEVSKMKLMISLEAKEKGEPIATTNEYPLPVQINAYKRKRDKILQQQKKAVEKKENPRPKKRRKKESAPT
jgi:hypothetical protein